MEFVLNEYHRNTPDEELIADVKRVADLLNKDTLSCKDYSEHGKYHYVTVKRRFGSWNDVLRHADLSVTIERSKVHEYCESDEDFFEDVRRVAQRFNRNYVTIGEYADYGRFAHSQRVKKFKRWGNVLEKAGLEQTPYRSGPNLKYSDEELFEEMERVWLELGRQPKFRDAKTCGIFKVTAATYIYHFGSWRKALEAFVKYINSGKDYEEIKDDIVRDSKEKTETKSQCAPQRKEPIKKNTPIIIHKTKRKPSDRLKVMVLMRDGNRCRLCGIPCNDGLHNMEFDHIIPWVKGGETTLEKTCKFSAKTVIGQKEMLY